MDFLLNDGLAVGKLDRREGFLLIGSSDALVAGLGHAGDEGCNGTFAIGEVRGTDEVVFTAWVGWILEFIEMMKHQDTPAQAIGPHLETGAVGREWINPCFPFCCGRRRVNWLSENTTFRISRFGWVVAVVVVEDNIEEPVRRAIQCDRSGRIWPRGVVLQFRKEWTPIAIVNSFQVSISCAVRFVFVIFVIRTISLMCSCDDLALLVLENPL